MCDPEINALEFESPTHPPPEGTVISQQVKWAGLAGSAWRSEIEGHGISYTTPRRPRRLSQVLALRPAVSHPCPAVGST